MDKILRLVSLISLVVHLLFIHHTTLWYFYFCGYLTSVLNHGFTNIYLKWLDRTIMAVGAVTNLILFVNHQDTLLFVLTICAIYSYVLAKVLDDSNYHVLSHIILTGVHIRYFWYYK